MTPLGARVIIFVCSISTMFVIRLVMIELLSVLLDYFQLKMNVEPCCFPGLP